MQGSDSLTGGSYKYSFAAAIVGSFKKPCRIFSGFLK